MEIVASRVSRRLQQAADLAYWLSRPMAERIAAVEALRAQHHATDGAADAEPRLQRVCRVARRQGR
ncbi:MAG: hypothetical protein HS128_13845 [Ideonella sp.]|nr:hypothetical protein [Ideonella sp.]MCC7458153.1 hypothetical protein [Nitrospira sp.]